MARFLVRRLYGQAGVRVQRLILQGHFALILAVELFQVARRVVAFEERHVQAQSAADAQGSVLHRADKMDDVVDLVGRQDVDDVERMVVGVMAGSRRLSTRPMRCIRRTGFQ